MAYKQDVGGSSPSSPTVVSYAEFDTYEYLTGVSAAVRPVPQERVDAIEPHVSRQVWVMIQLQLLTAARPGEILKMRPCDIDRSGKIWVYCPHEHKTAHHGHERKIYIGPKGQEILQPFLLRPVEAYCFSPAEQDQEKALEAIVRVGVIYPP